MIPLSTHLDYLTHLASQLALRTGNELFLTRLALYDYEFVTLSMLSIDVAREGLAALYCPTGQGDPRDPVCMLRSWLLMTLLKEHSPDSWADRLRSESALAMLAGFAPDDTPGASTHRDFLTRYADGPYEIRKTQDVTLSKSLKGEHERRLEDATEARRKEAGPNNTQSNAIVTRVLNEADQARNPNSLDTRLQNLLADLGILPSIEAGLIDEPLHLILNGDGTILETSASSEGKKTCDCDPRAPDCDHDRLYTSPTAQWCKDTHHTQWVFGDRSYTISIHVNRHDLPLMTIMGNGNESDFTLAPKALDALLKLLKEKELPFCPVIFTGDGHHDAQAIYLYLKEKGLIPIIPLRESSKTDTQLKKHPIPGKKSAAGEPETSAEIDTNTAADKPETPAESSTKTAESEEKSSADESKTPAKSESAAEPQTDATKKTTKKKSAPRPQVNAYPNILFEPDGTPLCPGKCRMRHHAYAKSRAAHLYNCPAKRQNGKGEWIFHTEDCPLGADCRPETKMGYFLYLKSEADLRLFPPIPRDTKRFKTLYHERTSVERSNSAEDSYKLDRAHRNATFGLMRLCVVNICKHANVRWIEAKKTRTKKQIFQDTLEWLLQGDFEAPPPM
jgi:hypothetical protein